VAKELAASRGLRGDGHIFIEYPKTK
jgi:hypothetical protein